MEKAVRFIIDHNESIIEWSIVAILILCLTWLILHYFFGAGESAEGGISHNQLDQLEKTLQSVLERSASGAGIGAAGVVRTEASTSGNSGAVAKSDSAVDAPTGRGASLEELEKLKVVLEDREVTIGELKAELEKAREATNDQELIDKIKTLEERLAEYEIIEDDIADLSSYKEENARLKDELDKLKAGGAVATSAPEPDSSEVANAPTPQEEDITEGVVEGEESDSGMSDEDLLDEFTDAASGEEVNPQDAIDALMTVSATKDESAAPPEDAQSAIDALMAESAGNSFETAQDEEEPPSEEALNADQMAEAVAALANDSGDSGATEEADPMGNDILGEFSPDGGSTSEPITKEVVDEITGSVVDTMAKGGSDTAAKVAAPLAENIDTDKMLDEINDMGEAEVDGSSLEEELDVDKMAAEAIKLASDS